MNIIKTAQADSLLLFHLHHLTITLLFYLLLRFFANMWMLYYAEVNAHLFTLNLVRDIFHLSSEGKTPLILKN